MDLVTALKYLGAGIAMISALGAGIGIGIGTGNACRSVAQQPEAEGKIRTTLILGSVLSEATAIYGFVIAILLLFVVK